MKNFLSALQTPSELRIEKSGEKIPGRKIKLFRPDYKFIRPEGDSEIAVEKLNIYIKDQHILKDINVRIPDKKITCIIGPSGCGKSTLLKTFNRLIDNVEGVSIEGKVLVNGEDIISSGTDITSFRRKMGLISQRPCPLPMSIYDNIAYGCRIHGIRNRRKLNLIVEHYLCAAGLWEEVKDRLHTPAVRLSIVADEATSALDPLSSKTIEELFVKLKQDYSIILVTHTLRQALRIADYVVFMYLGEIIEAGEAEQVFNHPRHELTKNYLSGAFS